MGSTVPLTSVLSVLYVVTATVLLIVEIINNRVFNLAGWLFFGTQARPSVASGFLIESMKGPPEHVCATAYHH